MKITITTLVIIEDMEVLDSFTFKVGASQGKAYIESQEISFNRGGTIINKEL